MAPKRVFQIIFQKQIGMLCTISAILNKFDGYFVLLCVFAHVPASQPSRQSKNTLYKKLDWPGDHISTCSKQPPLYTGAVKVKIREREELDEATAMSAALARKRWMQVSKKREREQEVEGDRAPI